MREPNTTKRFVEIENKLDTIYNSASPDPAFARRLELQLAERVRSMQNPALAPKPGVTDWLRGIFAKPILVIAFAVILLLVLSVGLVGPQKVLAQVQRLLGYAPGYGFVEPGETRILPAPVEVKQGEVTLRIENVVADSQGTQLVLQASGLPREKFGPEEMETPQDAQPYLLLPDGTRLAPQSAMSGIGDTLQASLRFAPLPEGITEVTLVLPRLPSLPAGFAPENWSVALRLEEVRTQTAGTAVAGGIPLTQPYTPENASATVHGVTARVLQVGQNAQETGLQVQFNWEPADWKWLSNVQMRLTDDAGHTYARHESALGSNFDLGEVSVAPGTRTATYRFDPLDSQAKTGVLVVDKLSFSITSQAHFRFDPGGAAVDGQTWDLSQLPGTRLDVAGVPVQLLSMDVSQNTDPRAGADSRYLLNLLVQTFPQDGLALDSLFMSPFADRTVSANGEVLPDSQLKLTIGLAKLPQRPMSLYLSSGELSVTGPWKMEWSIPVK